MNASTPLFSSIQKYLLLLSLFSFAVFAQEDYQAVTMVNPEIDVIDLEFSLVPLTKDELTIEVQAWTQVIKEKAVAVSKAEILENHKQRVIEGAEKIADISTDSTELLEKGNVDKNDNEELEEDLEAINEIAKEIVPTKSAENVEKMATKDAKSLSILAEKAEEYAEKEEIERDELIQDLAYLREEQRALLLRYNVVLDNWELKGGDSTEMRLYAVALSGIKVDLADTSAVWISFTAWLSSKDGGLRWLANFIKFTVAILFVLFLSYGAGRVTDAALSRNHNLSVLLKTFIKVSVRRVILGIGFIVSLTLIEINVAPVLALIGAAGLVIGLALQGTLSNFASGMLILIYRPYDVDDIIEIDGVVGTVDSMTLLSTSIKTFDNQHLIIPNNNVWGTTIVNVTGSETRRVDLVFGIGYADDMAKAQAIMEKVLQDNDMVLDYPESIVKVNELGDSSVNFVCRPWVKTKNYLDVFWDVTREVKEQFDKQGISIPFPQRDVHIHQISKEN